MTIISQQQTITVKLKLNVSDIVCIT